MTDELDDTDTGDGLEWNADSAFDEAMSEDPIVDDDGEVLDGDQDLSPVDGDDVVNDPAPEVKQVETRIQRKLLDSERRAVAAEAKIRELETKLQSSRPPQHLSKTGNPVLDWMQERAASLNVDHNDPRIMSELERFGRQIVATMAGDSVDDPDIRETRREMQRLEHEARLQSQIDDMKAERQREQEQHGNYQALNATAYELKALKAEESYPYLHASDDNVAAEVLAGIKYLMSTGYEVTPANQSQTVEYVCEKLEADRRAKAERLAKVANRGTSTQNGGNSGQQPNSQQTRGAREDGQQNRGEDRGSKSRNRTVTASGVGRRSVPKADAEKTLDELFEETLREEKLERSRNAAQRARRRN